MSQKNVPTQPNRPPGERARGPARRGQGQCVGGAHTIGELCLELSSPLSGCGCDLRRHRPERVCMLCLLDGATVGLRASSRSLNSSWSCTSARWSAWLSSDTALRNQPKEAAVESARNGTEVGRACGTDARRVVLTVFRLAEPDAMIQSTCAPPPSSPAPSTCLAASPLRISTQSTAPVPLVLLSTPSTTRVPVGASA